MWFSIAGRQWLECVLGASIARNSVGMPSAHSMSHVRIALLTPRHTTLQESHLLQVAEG